MKKMWIALIILACSVSGCQNLDYDMMVCGYKGMQSLSYEIRYKDTRIIDIAVVEYQDLRGVKDATYKTQLASIKKIRERREKYDGIHTYLEDNEREVTLFTEIDFAKYDCNKDKLSLLQTKLQKKDFKNVQTLRDKLVGQRFNCDEVVMKNQWF